MASRALIAMLSTALVEARTDRCAGHRSLFEHGLDLDLLAQRRAQQLCDVGDRGVDLDVARLQRLLARERQQMLDQLGAAFGGIVDQARRALQLRLLLQARHQRLGIARDHGQHVVEVVRDAAGQLADRIELLRLVQLPLGFARRGRVVIDQHGAGDIALPVSASAGR